MQKRPSKWFSHFFNNAWPGFWQIRHRIVTAGFILSVLCLLSPIYMRTQLTQLAQTYSRTTINWEVLDRIQEFSQLITLTESKLRAYSASHNRIWLATLGPDRARMDETLTILGQAAEDKPYRVALIKETLSSYDRWKSEVAREVANRAGRNSGEGFNDGSEEEQSAATQISGAQVTRLHQLLGELARDIRENSMATNREVEYASHRAVRVVTYGGLLFFIGFVALVFSLWFTLIPGLTQLLSAAKELKRGNLDHRVHIPGGSETAQLGRAFNEMAVSLKAQNEALKELNRLKTDFVSTVSHELRTPLTAIKGSIGLILGNVTGPIPHDAADMLNITQKNTDRLIRLINEVLDIAKIEAGAIQMHFDKHSLVDTLGHAVMGIEAFAQTRGIRLVWEILPISPLVVIDRDRLEQVLTNLLSNAIKFTEPGGTVSVHCEWESDRVVISVADTGDGIPEEFFDRIFHKFQQAEGASNHQKEGTGLGLAIAKAIVEEHGGSIWVTSKVGHGSTFSFSLPWNGTEFVENKKLTKLPADRSRRRILVIDDEPDFQTVLSMLLEHEGYEVYTASSGAEGVELAIQHKPDLVITDVHMPGLDGFGVKKILECSPLTQDIPVAFATVSPEVHNDERTRSAVAVFAKPLSPEDFKQWLANFFTNLKKAA